MDLTLYIANKNYSSWSFRPWIALTAAGIPFTDVLVRFSEEDGHSAIKALSPSGQVPVLRHGDLLLWESLAIIDYAAELFPDAGLWPADRRDRALAKAISMEMATGFRALRGACPMNFRRPKRAIPLPDGVMANVRRIETIWREQIARSGGPFLFGGFSAADAMYAPVVNRFSTYDLVSEPDTLAYMARMAAHPSWRLWEAAALAEPWIVEEDEA